MIRIHFSGFRAGLEPLDLACALGVGGFPPQRGPKGPEEGKNDRLNREARNHFEAVDADRADVFFFPYRAHDFPDDVGGASAEAARRGVPFVCLSWGDADDPISLSHGMVLRHSLYRDRLLPCERAAPAPCSDPLAELGRRLGDPREKRIALGRLLRICEQSAVPGGVSPDRTGRKSARFVSSRRRAGGACAERRGCGRIS